MTEESNVLYFNGFTKLDLSPDRVITEAIDKLDSVVILGHHKDGNEYFASSTSNGADVLWLLERAKLTILRIADDR